MVFQRSMLDWERGVGSICHRYVCIVLYIYMKLMWCNGFPKIYAQLEKWGWGQSAMGICALCYIYMKLIWCNGFSQISAGLMGGRSAGRSAKFGAAVFKASMLN